MGILTSLRGNNVGVADRTWLTKNPNHADWLYGRGVTKLRKGDAPGGNADIESAKTIKADIAEEYAKYGIK
jgi:hypothetical protein